jgi:hypothetical protein
MLRVHTSNLFHPLSQFLALLRKKVGENAPPAKKTLAAAAAASPSAQEQHSTLFGSNLPDATTSSSVSTQKTRKVALSALPGAMAPLLVRHQGGHALLHVRHGEGAGAALPL